ncbi:hypothetical protein D3C75_858490 [compost metagenome]
MRNHAAIGFSNSRCSIGHHRNGILIDSAAVGVEHLVKETPDLLLPFLAKLLQVRHSLMVIHEDETVRPAIFNRQLSKARQDSGRGLQRETLNGDYLDEFAAQLWRYAGIQLFAPNQVVDVDRIGWQHHGMIDAGNAELEPLQELIMGDG